MGSRGGKRPLDWIRSYSAWPTGRYMVVSSSTREDYQTSKPPPNTGGPNAFLHPMKKFALSMILIGATLGVAFAQAAGPTGGAPTQGNQKEKRAGNPMRRMQRLNQEVLGELTLTEVQKKQVKEF